ncbi:hypothetical protein M758_2G058700, partial [Ceratodon purpureus]
PEPSPQNATNSPVSQQNHHLHLTLHQAPGHETPPINPETTTKIQKHISTLPQHRSQNQNSKHSANSSPKLSPLAQNHHPTQKPMHTQSDTNQLTQKNPTFLLKTDPTSSDSPKHNLFCPVPPQELHPKTCNHITHSLTHSLTSDLQTISLSNLGKLILRVTIMREVKPPTWHLHLQGCKLPVLLQCFAMEVGLGLHYGAQCTPELHRCEWSDRNGKKEQLQHMRPVFML